MAMVMPMAVWFCHFDLVDASVDVVGLVLETLECSPWHAVEGLCFVGKMILCVMQVVLRARYRLGVG